MLVPFCLEPGAGENSRHTEFSPAPLRLLKSPRPSPLGLLRTWRSVSTRAASEVQLQVSAGAGRAGQARWAESEDEHWAPGGSGCARGQVDRVC